MKTQIIYTLLMHGGCSTTVEVFQTRAELLQHLLIAMTDGIGRRLHFLNNRGKKLLLKKWGPRLKKAARNPARIWPAWKIYTKEQIRFATSGMSLWFEPGEHDIELPAEIQKALQSADSSLTQYHRVLWHADKRHGGLEREAVVKTIKAIRKITRTNTPGQSL